MATLTLTLDDVRDLIVAADTPETEQLLQLLEDAVAETTSTGIAGRIDAIATHQSLIGTASTLIPKAVQNGFPPLRAAEIQVKAIKDLLTCQVLLLSASRAIALVEKSLGDVMAASDDPMIKRIAPVIDALNSVPPLQMAPFREIYFPGSDADASQ
jgi:hypothetical protein